MATLPSMYKNTELMDVNTNTESNEFIIAIKVKQYYMKFKGWICF